MGIPLDLIERMQQAGLSREDIQAIIDNWNKPVPSVDSAAEKKRAYNRERMRDIRANVVDVVDNTTTITSPPPLPPNGPPPPSLHSSPSPPIIPPSPPPAPAAPTLVFPSSDDLQWAVDEWNEMAAKIDLPKVVVLNATRRKKLTTRLRELESREAWQAVLWKVSKSPFCRGETSGFRANFDFVLQPSSMLKLLEGNYDETERRRKGNEGPGLFRTGAY